MPERPQPKRWRCLTTGCNPKLNEASAAAHAATTGHRVAKWPVRSKAGIRKAEARNRTGYYDRYNVGAKSAAVRLGHARDPDDEPHPDDDYRIPGLGWRSLNAEPRDQYDDGNYLTQGGDGWDD